MIAPGTLKYFSAFTLFIPCKIMSVSTCSYNTRSYTSCPSSSLILNAINTAIKNNKIVELPECYHYTEFTTQIIQFEVMGENIIFELCLERDDIAMSIICSIVSYMPNNLACHRYFRINDYNITPKQLVELFGLGSYTFKITMCEGPKNNYMTTPVHSVPLSQFDLYRPKA